MECISSYLISVRTEKRPYISLYSPTFGISQPRKQVVGQWEAAPGESLTLADLQDVNPKAQGPQGLDRQMQPIKGTTDKKKAK